jgi:hypothetical protein
MFENKGQHLASSSAARTHMNISALDSELLASTSKKQRWRNSTLRESCRAAFRYPFFNSGYYKLLMLSLAFVRRAEAERQLDGEPDPEDVREEDQSEGATGEAEVPADA